MENPIQWNSIQPNNGNFLYIPFSKQIPHQSTNANGNNIQKPSGITIHRPPPKDIYSSHMDRHQPTTLHQFPRDADSPRPAPHPQFQHPKFEEYLLHAQMPLPIATTFVMVNKAETEHEFLT